MNTTKHFRDSEFTCKHCGGGAINRHLLPILELVRVKFGKPVYVTSAYRCPVHNKNVGGADNSKHVLGEAVDISVDGVSPQEVYEFLDTTFPHTYGLGLYVSKGFVHIDIRSVRARWSK